MTYTLTQIPKAPGNRSRFALPETEAGWPIDPGEALGAAFKSLVASRRAAMKPLEPAPITVALRFAAKVGETWELLDRGSVTAVPALEAQRPGKLGQTKIRGGELLDSFALGGEAWEKATDAEVFAALLVVSEAHDLVGRGWRELQDSVARLVLLRAGLEVSEEALPHPNVPSSVAA